MIMITNIVCMYIYIYRNSELTSGINVIFCFTIQQRSNRSTIITIPATTIRLLEMNEYQLWLMDE